VKHATYQAGHVSGQTQHLNPALSGPSEWVRKIIMGSGFHCGQHWKKPPNNAEKSS